MGHTSARAQQFRLITVKQTMSMTCLQPNCNSPNLYDIECQA